MNILFLLFLIIIIELNCQSGAANQIGVHPYRWGHIITTVVSVVASLGGCIWYCGWLWGGFLALIVWFLGHTILGWIFNLPIMLCESPKLVVQRTRICAKIALFASFVFLIFVVFSVFTVPYESLTTVISSLGNRIWIVIALLIVSTLCNLFITAWQKSKKTNNPF